MPNLPHARISTLALRALALAVLAVSACSPRAEDRVAVVDASVVEVGGAADPGARAIADQVRATLAPEPALSSRFAATSEGLRRDRDGVTSPGFRGAWVDRSHQVGARLPDRADHPFFVGVGVSERYRLELAPLGAAPAPLGLDGGRGVYHDAYPSTDVTFAASADRLEWAYTLRDEKAPRAFELRVRVPKALRAVSDEPAAGVSFVDEQGSTLLRIPRAVAIDAAGASREASIRWDGERLAVALDPTGMKYPIVLDPAIEVPVWDVRVRFPYTRIYSASAYDSIRKRVVVFGGRVGSSDTNETWEWDGANWSLRATSGPTGRHSMSMAFDVARGLTVMYGGSSGAGETWEWDGTTWFQRCTSAPCSTTTPGAVSLGAMTYDAARANVVLLGSTDTWTWDGALWIKRSSAGPTGRVGSSMTYDAGRSRVLLFGGGTPAGPPYYADLWSWNGTAWSPVSTAGGPPSIRGYASFVALTATGKALLFGGRENSNWPASDAWTLDLATDTWSAFAGAEPPGRFYATATYDSQREAVVLFGGQGNNAVQHADTWEFRASTADWKRAVNDIGGRSEATTAFDAFRNRIVLFGGYLGGATLSDTWEWSGFGWSEVCTTAPCNVDKPYFTWGAKAVFDSARNRVVLVAENQIFEYDGVAWAHRCTTAPCNTNIPTSRSYVAAAFDAGRGKTVVFGGSQGGDETWEWDGAAWSRACTDPACAATLPPTRQMGGMAYDASRGRTVLFGGKHPTTNALVPNETWEFSGTAWTKTATTGPAARENGRLAYDSTRKKIVLFGGTLTGTPAFDDTWEYDGATATWTQTSTPATGKRGWNTLTYDAARRRVVMYGDATAARPSDTWEYYTRGGGCSLGTECATGFCVDGVCCEQISCSTCQACDTAGAPGRCAAVVNGVDTDTCPAATSACDGAGICKLKQAQACTASSQCASGSCANGFCCDATCGGGCDVCNVTPGTCTTLAKGTTGASPSCGAYLCDGASGACPSVCAADADCAASYFCDATGVCQLRRAVGGACNLASGGDCKVAGCRECSGSATCKDGYCCGTACSGACQTCAATPGSCTTVKSAEDADTCAGISSCSASGACLAKQGQSCTAPSQCASGSCVDGFCCNTPCAGGCDVCSATPGTCTVLAQGSAGVACGSYACNGSSPSCPTTCGNDADCASSAYCAANGTCQSRKAQGATCNQAAGVDCKSSGCRVCSTGNCIDGFCCDSACGGSCDGCNGAALGWSGATNGTCALAPVSYAGSPACVGYACSGASPACATGCTSDAQCAAGSYCDAAGACVARKAQGASCNLAVDCKTAGTCRACASGNCVDGRCCNSACTGQCQACDVAGAEGTCLAIAGTVHPNAAGATPRAACSGSGACGATCNGVDPLACRYPGAATACGGASCSAGVATNVGTCDGGGACAQSTTPCGAFKCGAAACATSCASDAECADASYYCSGGACVLKQPLGNGCASAGACQSGHCVGGVCCDSACSGVGFSCNLPTARGRCAKANAAACGSSAECGSGFCVDGVCCDSACAGQCQACDATGLVGTCSPVTGAPHGARAACAGTGAGTACGPTCDGKDAAGCSYPTGSAKCGADACTDGSPLSTVTHLGVCNGAGSCSASAGDCGTYRCAGTTCRSSCVTAAECQSGNYCKAGFCVPIEGLGVPCTDPSACPSGFCTNGVCCASASCGLGASCNATTDSAGRCAKLQGSACTTASECASSHCVDGFCCDSGCTGACEACGVSGKEGTCVPVVGQPRAGHPACGATPGDATCGPSCNGTDAAACHDAPTSVSCGAPSCSGGRETVVTTCDGGGHCPVVQRSCGAYQCGATTCLTACGSDGECATGSFCKSGACVGVQELGNPCDGDGQCRSGHCADGVCCGVVSCGAGAACAGLGANAGQCLKGSGVACGASGECASGHCVDGLCCDKGCDGQCEACDVKGSEGTCTPVHGAPHGATRAACDGLAAGDCARAMCDGDTRDKCAGFANDTTTPCGADACTVDRKLQKRGACDGHGACALPEPTSCTEYACDPAATVCRTSCAVDEHCGASFKCEVASGKCVQGATCSEDRRQSIDKSGVASACAPYMCGTDGKCLKSCATSDDCVSGTSCDDLTHACVGIATTTESGGGCGLARERRPSTSLGVGALGALVAAALARRRRSARA